MERLPDDPLVRALLESLPADGSALGNVRFRYLLNAKVGRDVPETEHQTRGIG